MSICVMRRKWTNILTSTSERLRFCMELITHRLKWQKADPLTESVTYYCGNGIHLWKPGRLWFNKCIRYIRHFLLIHVLNFYSLKRLTHNVSHSFIRLDPTTANIFTSNDIMSVYLIMVIIPFKKGWWPIQNNLRNCVSQPNWLIKKKTMFVISSWSIREWLSIARNLWIYLGRICVCFPHPYLVIIFYNLITERFAKRVPF